MMYSGSSIADLKAELSRKQDLVKASSSTGKKVTDESKQGKSTFDKIHAMTGRKKKKKAKTKETIIENANSEKELDSETVEILAKARQKLEAKSKIYEKMKSGEMEDLENIYGETKFLVDFQKKKFDKKDLDDESDDESSATFSKKTSIYEADEEYRENQREKWEAEQKELLDGPVHYENIKFDEIRDLGTGYYAFSKNEEERKKQMDDLQKLRNDTINIQNKKDLLHKKRKNALQERLNKIKQRKLGLDVSTETDTDSLPDELKNEANSSSSSCIPSTGTALEIEKDTELDQMLKECRGKSQSQREWDIGKDSKNYQKQAFVPQKKTTPSIEKIFKEKREERAEEFAPPNFY